MMTHEEARRHAQCFAGGAGTYVPDWVVEAMVSASSRSELADVKAFAEKFRLPLATQPSFLPPELYKLRVARLLEELNEFEEAHEAGDMHGAGDALVDLAYILYGTVLHMGLPWQSLWDEVQRANMSKERARSAAHSKHKNRFDIVKPAGWRGPDHAPALGEGPWPFLELPS